MREQDEITFIQLRDRIIEAQGKYIKSLEKAIEILEQKDQVNEQIINNFKQYYGLAGKP